MESGRDGEGYFPIHPRSSQPIIPSTTARNVVAMNRLRSVNRHGHCILMIITSDPRREDLERTGRDHIQEAA
jgi:hypothetical protein